MAKFVHSVRYTGLTGELSRLAVGPNTKFVVISNLTRTLVGLTETAGIPKAIEEALGSLLNLLGLDLIQCLHVSSVVQD